LTPSPVPLVSYDVLSLNLGSSPQLLHPSLASTANLTLSPVKPIDSFCARWDIILQRCVRTAARGEALSLCVVGAGAGGVEVVLAMQARIKRELRTLGIKQGLVSFSLLSRRTSVLPIHSGAAQRTFADILVARGVAVYYSAEVAAVRQSSEGRPVLECTDGTQISCDECIWLLALVFFCYARSCARASLVCVVCVLSACA